MISFKTSGIKCSARCEQLVFIIPNDKTCQFNTRVVHSIQSEAHTPALLCQKYTVTHPFFRFTLSLRQKCAKTPLLRGCRCLQLCLNGIKESWSWTWSGRLWPDNYLGLSHQYQTPSGRRAELSPESSVSIASEAHWIHFHQRRRDPERMKQWTVIIYFRL